MLPTDAITVQTMKVPTQLPVFVCNLAHIADQLDLARQAIDDLRRDFPEATPSNVKAQYMSPWDSHMHSAKLAPLCNSVITIAQRCAHLVNAGGLDALEMELIVANCWGVIYEGTDTALRHNHFPAEFAAVVYLEAEENCAPIVFNNGVCFKPHPGTMVIFPGIMDHEVPTGNGRRVVVAMNLYKRSTFRPPVAA